MSQQREALRGRSSRTPPDYFSNWPKNQSNNSSDQDEPVSEVECICGERIKVPKKSRHSGSKVRRSGSKIRRGTSAGSRASKKGRRSVSKVPKKSRSGSKVRRSTNVDSRGSKKSRSGSKASKAKLPQHNSPLVRKRVESIRREWLANSGNKLSLSKSRSKSRDQSKRSVQGNDEMNRFPKSHPRPSLPLSRSGSKNRSGQGSDEMNRFPKSHPRPSLPLRRSVSKKRSGQGSDEMNRFPKSHPRLPGFFENGSVSKSIGKDSRKRYVCKNCGAENTIEELSSGLSSGFVRKKPSKMASNPFNWPKPDPANFFC